MSDHIVQLTTMEELEKAVTSSSDRPVFVYKHSTVCPVSARAADQYHDFAEEDASSPAPMFTQVMVIEHRDISNAIESRLDVRHESPQLLLLRDGKVAWHASHFSITGKAISQALEG
ncbi:MAG: bacillithiol system redox-active protein YtxJ [Gemmatimonadetes bacterium]|nr:bacillithiol system redox-active protein YtxJ [Gemmatimonadota bacterium]